MRVIESVAGWDRFKIVDHRGNYGVRWYDPVKQKQFFESIQSRDLVAAREEALVIVWRVIAPEDLIENAVDPTIEEVWPFYEKSRAEETTPARQILLASRWINYYRDRLGKYPCSQIESQLRLMRDELVKHGKPWKEGRKLAKGKLSPNTIQEIVDAPRAAVNLAIAKNKVKGVPQVDKIKVPGFTKPRDRDPKGRYLGLEEIGALIDAAGNNLDELLIECGCAARIGAVTDLTIDQVYLAAGIFDLLPPGAPQTTKGRPYAPISGPLWWVFRDRLERNVADRHVILYRSEAVTKKTRSQTMRRMRTKAGLSEPDQVRWYSIRHTLSDFLDERVSVRARSMMLGHAELFDAKEKRKLLDPRSPMSDIYRRETLGPIYEIADALNEFWWPEIQKHCKTDLRLSEVDTPQIRLIYVSDKDQ